MEWRKTVWPQVNLTTPDTCCQANFWLVWFWNERKRQKAAMWSNVIICPFFFLYFSVTICSILTNDIVLRRMFRSVLSGRGENDVGWCHRMKPWCLWITMTTREGTAPGANPYSPSGKLGRGLSLRPQLCSLTWYLAMDTYSSFRCCFAFVLLLKSIQKYFSWEELWEGGPSLLACSPQNVQNGHRVYAGSSLRTCQSDVQLQVGSLLQCRRKGTGGPFTCIRFTLKCDMPLQSTLPSSPCNYIPLLTWLTPYHYIAMTL